MIMNKYNITIFFVLVVVYQCFGQDQYYGLPEEGCTRQGGMCITKTQCPTSPVLGLCPKQQSAGIECCNGLPKDEKRCQKLGGHCVVKNTCKPVVIHKKANDCRSDEECCILVV